MSLSSAEFRKIETSSPSDRGEQLFLAAANAFCSLVRPSRQEIRQLDELSLALIDSVSSDAKRYVAALISANPFAPRALVMRLCEEAPAISAPLISRSPLLNATDIVNLIARFGKGHARPAASRQSLDPAVRAMLALLVKDEAKADRTPTTSEPHHDIAHSADAVRDALRTVMTANTDSAILKPRERRKPVRLDARLLPTALSGNPVFFRTALADAAGISFHTAGEILDGASYLGLLTALKALSFKCGDAFMIVSAVFPGAFPSTESVRLFSERYGLLTGVAAKDRLAVWQLATPADASEEIASQPKPFEAGGPGLAANDPFGRQKIRA